ncbi:unnamed protein product, partial [Rotaria sordida]
LIPNENFDSITIHKTTAHVLCTVCQYSANNLWQLFKYAPMVKSLHVETLNDSSFINKTLDFIHIYSFYLKELIVIDTKVSVEIFQSLLNQTPNLKILTTTVEYQLDVIDREY